MKLILVDDNDGMRRLIKSTVLGPGDVVHESSDGNDAFVLYAKHRPDWVVMDIGMPKVDGVAATRQIKEAFPEARIVVISQYDDPELREAVRRAGAVEYVLKDNLMALHGILGGPSAPAESLGEPQDPQSGEGG